MNASAHFKIGLVGAAIVAVAFPATAQSPQLAMLDALTRGDWNLRVRNGEASERNVCLRTGRELIQLKHRGQACDRFVVQDSAEQVVVQYTCRGDGYGRTTIRRESNGLVQVRSEGIQGGAPFSFSGEARHVGNC